ncbi:MAG: hypothetical protein R3195_13505 [Gemmatimonadota bacterium]|nr:hypothetical protein [Gemmatimonadota bacterium]
MSYPESLIVAPIVQEFAEPARQPLWRVVLRDFPLDASAIFLYVLLAGAIALVWWGNRRSGGGSHIAHTPTEPSAVRRHPDGPADTDPARHRPRTPRRAA